MVMSKRSFHGQFCGIIGGGGPTTKKIMPPGKPQDVLCLFDLFQNTFKIDVFVPNLVKNVSSKKIMIFVFFDLLCSFLFFFVVFAGFG